MHVPLRYPARATPESPVLEGLSRPSRPCWDKFSAQLAPVQRHHQRHHPPPCRPKRHWTRHASAPTHQAEAPARFGTITRPQPSLSSSFARIAFALRPLVSLSQKKEGGSKRTRQDLLLGASPGQTCPDRARHRRCLSLPHIFASKRICIHLHLHLTDSHPQSPIPQLYILDSTPAALPVHYPFSTYSSQPGPAATPLTLQRSSGCPVCRL